MAASYRFKSLNWLVALGFLASACGPSSGSDTGRPAAPFTPGTGGLGGGGQGANSGSNDGGAFDGNPFVITFPDALATTDATGAGGGGEGSPDTLEACGATAFRLERNPPEVVLVLDRSGSMRRTAEGGVPGTEGLPFDAIDRWTYTSNAVNAVVKATEDNVRWGMKMYPMCTPGAQSGNVYPCSPNPCSVEGGYTSADVGQFQTISSAVAGAKPALNFGATPTAHAVKDAAAKIKASGRETQKYLLLATDGVPNCKVMPDPPLNPSWPAGTDIDGSQVQFAVDAVKAAHDEGIPVFVLGIAISEASAGAEAQKAHAALNQMALAGGKARENETVKYYSAVNEAALKDALAEIAAATVSCDIPLGREPPENAQTRVDVDDGEVKEDAAQGWTWTTPAKKSITLNGDLCMKLKRGELKKTVISFGCPGKPPPKPPITL